MFNDPGLIHSPDVFLCLSCIVSYDIEVLVQVFSQLRNVKNRKSMLAVSRTCTR